MHSLALAPLALLVASAVAKQCVNQTVPVTISARQGIFNIDVPQTSLDATVLIQNITQQGRNFTESVLNGYQTVSGTYNISTQFCSPDTVPANPTVQVLTHGIGFDKTYWDSPYNNFNYSYVNTAVDEYCYCTLAIDRLGIGNSSHGEPLNEIQAPIEIAAIAALTKMLRQGTFPGVKAIQKVVHVGHSFGSGQTYALANMDPTASDGIVLTGFATNSSFTGFFGAGANFVQAYDNQPFRLGSKVVGDSGVTNAYGELDYSAALPTPLNYPPGYLTNANINSNQYNFFLPKFFDLGALVAGEQTKQPVTPGELLTLTSLPMMNQFAGPVLVITGQNDLPFCGGNCLATGDPSLPSIPAADKRAFPNAGDNFEAYIQPNTGHGLNFHYNQTGSYRVINDFLAAKGLASS